VGSGQRVEVYSVEIPGGKGYEVLNVRHGFWMRSMGGTAP
jgi:hypothetical protein